MNINQCIFDVVIKADYSDVSGFKTEHRNFRGHLNAQIGSKVSLVTLSHCTGGLEIKRPTLLPLLSPLNYFAGVTRRHALPTEGRKNKTKQPRRRSE